MIFQKGQYTLEIDALLAIVVCVCITLCALIYVLDTNTTQRVLLCVTNNAQYSREKQSCIAVEK